MKEVAQRPLKKVQESAKGAGDCRSKTIEVKFECFSIHTQFDELQRRSEIKRTGRVSS